MTLVFVIWNYICVILRPASEKDRNQWLSQYKRWLPNGQTYGKITWTAGASRNDSCSTLEWGTAGKEFEVKEARFSVLDKGTICHRKCSKNKENWDQKYFKIVRLHSTFYKVGTNVLYAYAKSLSALSSVHTSPNNPTCCVINLISS